MEAQFQFVLNNAGVSSAEVCILSARDPRISEFVLSGSAGHILLVFASPNQSALAQQIMTLAGAKLIGKGAEEESGKDGMFYFVKFNQS